MDRYDFIVIGSGPVGQKAAIQAARPVKKVAAIGWNGERETTAAQAWTAGVMSRRIKRKGGQRW